MVNQQPSTALLSPHRAFVVQLYKDTPLDAEQVSGRAEHIVSGQATRFSSVTQLLVFMQQVLDSKRQIR